MKRAFFSIVLMIIFLPVFAIGAENLLGNLYEGNLDPWATNTLLSATNATGDGSEFDLKVPVPQHACTVTWGGTAPTSVTVMLKGSQDGTNYDTLATLVVAASPTIFHVIEKPGISKIKGRFDSKTGGDATTSVTMSCTSGGL